MTHILKKPKACVVILGDIGRSPRMQYHVESLLEEGFDVEVIGYNETPPLENVQKHAVIRKLTPVPELNFPSTLNYIFKTLWQTLSLLIAFVSISKPKFVICQNPPAIPTLFVCYLYCLIMRSKFIIDWHNYAFTIMALSSSPQSFLVKIAKRLEIYFGRKSSSNICVTNAMKEDLNQQYGIRYACHIFTIIIIPNTMSLNTKLVIFNVQVQWCCTTDHHPYLSQ